MHSRYDCGRHHTAGVLRGTFKVTCDEGADAPILIGTHSITLLKENAA